MSNKTNKLGDFDNYLDLLDKYHEVEPFYHDGKSKTYWKWDSKKYYWEMVSSPTIVSSLIKLIKLDVSIQSILTKVKNAIIYVGINKVPKEAPIKWLQFRDQAFSLKSKKIYDITPDYFFTNPIPWSIGETSDTPVMDKLFTEWAGEKYAKDLYEIIAYACYRKYPIQVLTCLTGSGRNGKSCFLNVLSNFLGKHNCAASSLDLLSSKNGSRFESFKLYRKLICVMGETNFDTMGNTETIKKLVGGDLMDFEKKFADNITAPNYAKLIIATNSLPTTTDDTDGFYRRWNIIKFNNEFEEGEDIVDTIPEQEYRNLARKCTEILPELLKRKQFINQGTIEQRKLDYISVSNPFMQFFNKNYIITNDGKNDYIEMDKVYIKYLKYLRDNKVRSIKRKEFKNGLEAEGFTISRVKKVVNKDATEFGERYKQVPWIEGIKYKIKEKIVGDGKG